MLSTLHGTSANAPKISRKMPLSERLERSIGAFVLLGLGLILLLAFLFLSSSNRIATRGYDLKVLENERAELLGENEILRMQIAEAQSLDRLAEDQVIQSMVKANEPLYIRGDTAVAQK